MQDIASILTHAVPTPPADFLGAETVKPLWLQCCSASLARVEPQWYCRGRLSVVVPGSAFAARLRQEWPDLMARLRTQSGLQDLSEVIVRVIETPRPRAEGAEPVPARRSPEAARCLAGLALEVVDPELRASLDRLATTLGTEAKGAKDVLKTP